MIRLRFPTTTEKHDRNDPQLLKNGMDRVDSPIRVGSLDARRNLPTKGKVIMETIVLSSAKHGQGVTTTAVALAATIAKGTIPGSGVKTNIASVVQSDELPAVLGVNAGEWLDEYVAPDLHAGHPRPKDTAVEVLDAGTLPVGTNGRHFLVIRPCYLALRAAMRQGTDIYEGVIFMDEPGRALTQSDIEQTLGIPIVAVVPVDPSIARAVDAGILVRRIPEIIAKPLRKVR